MSYWNEAREPFVPRKNEICQRPFRMPLSAVVRCKWSLKGFHRERNCSGKWKSVERKVGAIGNVTAFGGGQLVQSNS